MSPGVVGSSAVMAWSAFDGVTFALSGAFIICAWLFVALYHKKMQHLKDELFDNMDEMEQEPETEPASKSKREIEPEPYKLQPESEPEPVEEER